jgi:DNA polymerase elongation subunit (family B)
MSDFYTNISVLGKYILYRGVENDKRVLRKIEYRPTLYLPSNEKSQFKTLAGEYVKQFLRQSEGVDNFRVYGNTRYEYTFINEKFQEDILWDISKVKIAYIDIEVGSENGFPEPDDANEEITAITIKFPGSKYFVFACGEYENTREDVSYARCRDELELIKRFLDFWTLHYPDVVTGWSVKEFDIPYIINRITKVFGEDEAKKFSPWKKISPRETYFKGQVKNTYEIYGVSTLDYKELYQKFRLVQRESYTLNYISHIELKKKKIDYSEHENLHQLYKKDFQKFIDYNIRDVELVEELESTLNYINQSLTIAYDNKVNYADVFAQVRMWDAIVHNYLLRKNIVVPQMVSREKIPYDGAYVKEPVPGLYKWVVSFDLNSLYPHLIMQYNMSMETLIEPKNYNEEMRQFLTQQIDIDSILQKKVDTDVLKQLKLTVTPNRQLFSTKSRGVMGDIMDNMYKDRTKYKKMAIECKKKLKTVQDDKNQVEYLTKQISRYNNLQNAKKVTLNSAYGAMGNEYFRFFDVRIAAAITAAGQVSILWIQNKLNEYLNKTLGTTGFDYVIASDTDSVYLNLGPLVEKVYGATPTAPTHKIIDFMDKVCKQKIQPFIDDSYEELKDYINAYQQRMEMKRESLADKAVWTAKKRYILNVYNDEGVAYETPVLKIVGLEAIKSSTPAVCRENIKKAIAMLIDGSEKQIQDFVQQFKSEFLKLPPEDIAFPTSVNGLAEYHDSATLFKKGAPIHVKGSLVYNKFLTEMNLTKDFQTIKEGEKIRYVYLKQPNPFNNNTIAFISVLPKQFNAKQYIDYEMQFQKTFVSPLQAILDAIGWSTEHVNNLDCFFD